MQLLTLAAILSMIGGVLFALQNNVPVVVSFAVWQFEGSLALVLSIVLALGALAIALASTPATLRMQWHLARQKRQIAHLEKDLCNRQVISGGTAPMADEETAPRIRLRIDNTAGVGLPATISREACR